MMPRVAGVDWSLTKTGVGIVTQRADGTCLASTALVRSTGPGTKAARLKAGKPEKPTLVERRARMAGAAEDVITAVRGSEVVVIEELVTGPSAAGASRADLIAGWWYVVGGLLRRGTPVAVVVGSSLKLAIAGKGNADKGAVSAAVTRLWPEIEIAHDDEGDALGLAHLAAVRLGWDVETLARHRDVKWQEWPEFPDPSTTGRAA